MSAQPFLDGVQLRPVRLPEGCPFQPVGLALGHGASALEVLVTSSTTEPGLPRVRSVWRQRSGDRAAPLVLVVLYDGKATALRAGRR